MALAPPLNVAVIGAGMAGIAAARSLKAEGLQVVVFEKSDQIGGTWVYNPQVESDPLGQDPNRDIVHSSLYRSLRTNLPRQLMGFSDYPFGSLKVGDSGRTFPGHEEVLQYLHEFAEEFGIVELIRFGCEVIRVERVGFGNDDEWVVECKSDERSFQEVFDAVVICNGHYTKPRLATFTGIEKWSGEHLHSHNYRGPEPFQNKIVVVIGSSASGWDISNEISCVAKEIHVSSRMSNSIKESLFKLESRDNISSHSEIDHVHGDREIVFQDGSSVFADVILHCSGYEYYFPFLKTDGLVTVDDNRVGPLYKHVFPPKLAPRLSFVGLPYKSLIVPMIELQTKWIAHVLSGKGTLPSEEEMLNKVEEHYNDMEANGIPKRHTHRVGFEACFEYMDFLAGEAGLMSSQVNEDVKIFTKSYLDFVFQNNFLKAREWEPTNSL